MAKIPKITLEQRESDDDAIKALVPTRARVAVQLYDHRRPSRDRYYRALSGLSTIIPVYSRREVLALWTRLEAVLHAEDWHDARARDSGASRPGDPRTPPSST